MTQSVWDYLLFRARLRPYDLAVFGPAGPVSNRRLIEDVAGLATELLERGLTETDMVGISLPNSYVHLLLVLALDRLNIPSASLLAQSTSSALKSLATSCFLSVMVSSEPEPDPSPCRWVQMAELDRPKIGRGDRTRLRAIECPVDRLVRIIWSSGTTGGPKGSPMTRARQMLRIAHYTALLGDTSTSRYFLAMGLSPSFGYGRALAVLTAGGTLVLPGVTMEFGLLVETLGITVLGGNIPILTELLAGMERSSLPMPKLHLEITGSNLPAKLAREARERLTPNVRVIYGTSESSTIAVADAAVVLGDPAAAGFLAPSIEAQIVDDTDQSLPAGREGRLRMRAAQVVESYYRNEAAARRNFRDGWFYPGDVGTIGAEGLLRITGRIEDVARHGGALLSPVPIETAIAGLPGVRDVAAFVLAGPDGSQQSYVALVLAPGTSATAILAQSKAQLGEGSPAGALVLDALPRNANGKVMKRELMIRLRQATQNAPAVSRSDPSS